MIITFFVFIAFFSVYGGAVYIAPLDGWTLTPVHGGSSALLKDSYHDRTIYENKDFSHLERYHPTSCWVRRKKDGDYFCAIKSGVLCELRLADAEKWHHSQEALKILQEFSREAGRNQSFLTYIQKKTGNHYIYESLMNVYRAAVRDLLYKKTEPEGSGWNLVLDRSGGLFERHLYDIGGAVSWKDGGGSAVKFSEKGEHFDGTIWLRHCGIKLYVYGRMQRSLVVCDWEKCGQNLDFLKKLCREYGCFEDRKSVDLFRKDVEKTLITIVDGGENVHVCDLMDNSLPFTNNQPGGWSVKLMHSYHPSLIKGPKDCVLVGSVDSANVFNDETIWVRKEGSGKNSLCAWKGGVYYCYDNLDDSSRWRHLPITQETLKRFANTSCDSLEIYFEDDRNALIAMRNGCIAAVRDCPWRPIEMEPNCSLIVSPWAGVFAKNDGDIELLSFGFSQEGTYREGEVWLHLCGQECFLRAVMEQDLFQCKIVNEDSAPYWSDFPKLHAALKKISTHGWTLSCLTFQEDIIVRNSLMAFICNALYGKREVKIDHYWVAHIEQHKAIFNQTAGDHVISTGMHQQSREYVDRSIWWRFDEEESLCLRYGDVLLRYKDTLRPFPFPRHVRRGQEDIRSFTHIAAQFLESEGKEALRLDPTALCNIQKFCEYARASCYSALSYSRVPKAARP